MSRFRVLLFGCGRWNADSTWIVWLDANPKGLSRIIDLDVDIGADAVDYKYVPFRSTTSLYYV